eukprot:scaffold215630_cov27-Tisochrysis_lutea.AAC.2
MWNETDWVGAAMRPQGHTCHSVVVRWGRAAAHPERGDSSGLYRSFSTFPLNYMAPTSVSRGVPACRLGLAHMRALVPCRTSAGCPRCMCIPARALNHSLTTLRLISSALKLTERLA